NVGVSRSETLSVALRALSVVPPAISGLVHASQGKDAEERHRITARSPRQFEFVLRPERSCIRDVAGIEVRNQAKHTLFFLLLDLQSREFLRRQSDVHFGYLSGDRQDDYGGDVSLSGLKRSRHFLRHQIRRRNRETEPAWRHMSEREKPVSVRCCL